MKEQSRSALAGKVFGVVAGVLLCLNAGAANAQDAGLTAAQLLDEDSTPAAFEPFPLLGEQSRGGLAFDLAGSDQRKLQLELSDPLIFGTTTESRWLDFGGGEVAIGASLDWLLNDNFSLGAGVERGAGQQSFQSLGSIHCENGILEAGSYRASDCYFVNEANDLDFGTVSIGANYEINNNATAAINLFRREAGQAGPGIRRLGSLGGAPVLDAGLLTPVLTNPLLPQPAPLRPLNYLESEVTGIDLEFEVGVSTDRAGDMRLGLQLTRILDGQLEAVPENGLGLQNWTVAEPVDSARMSFDWRKGAFSGGIQSFYRAPVEFMNRDSLDSITTFDVHFTWRTPWNASLSVGATNLLNSGADDAGVKNGKLNDPFESVYGRIPYVRYQQDL